MFNPCVDHCYLRHGKQYTKECDEICDYARVVKELAKHKELIAKIIETQKLCAMCGNSNCKNSNTSDVGCKPFWNGVL